MLVSKTRHNTTFSRLVRHANARRSTPKRAKTGLHTDTLCSRQRFHDNMAVALPRCQLQVKTKQSCHLSDPLGNIRCELSRYVAINDAETETSGQVGRTDLRFDRQGSVRRYRTDHIVHSTPSNYARALSPKNQRIFLCD